MHPDAAPGPPEERTNTDRSHSSLATADAAAKPAEPSDTHVTLVAESKAGRVTERVAPGAGPPTVGGYQILGELGRGGMGIVYKAQDPELKRLVALKMLWAGPHASIDDLIRFRGEAEAIAQLQHPNIVQIYETGQHNGQPYLALEYVDGTSLDKVTHSEPQPPRQAAEWVEILARAVHVAHRQDIIHRDLKPANVLLTQSGVLKITDFGLAKRLDQTLGLSRTGDVMGTPFYMAPEQASGRGHDAGPATDVYALGAILYELFTGRPPFKGASILETLEQVREAEPASPTRLVPRLHRDLGTICLKCLQKSPARRYPSAEALADDLRRWMNGLPIEARPVSGAERFWRSVKRHPAIAALVASGGAMVVALTFLGIVLREQAQERKLQESQQKLREADEAHQTAIREQENRYRDWLQEQRNISLKALNDILDLVTRDDSPLSRQAGLEPLHKTLLYYYDQLVQQQAPNKRAETEQLAAAYSRLGELMRRTGNKERALDAFGNAAKLYAELAEAPGSSPAFRHQLARARLGRGALQKDLGHVREAQAEYEAARGQLEQLVQLPASRPEYKQELAEVWHKKAELDDTLGDKRAAKAAFEKARDLREQLPDRYNTPAYLRDLARSYGYLGDVELNLDDFAAADTSYWTSHKHRLALAKDPTALEPQFQLARSYGNFGNYQLRVRAFDTAIDRFEKAQAIRDDLVAKAPAVTEYVTDWAGGKNRLAELHILKGRPKDGPDPEQLLREATARLEQLPAAKQTDTTVRSTLADGYILLAELLCDVADRREQARDYLHKGRELLQKLCEQRPDPSDLYRYAVALALTNEMHGKGDPGPALEQLRQAARHGYRRKHAADVEQQRGFRSLREDKDFQQFLCEYRQGPAVPSSKGESR